MLEEPILIGCVPNVLLPDVESGVVQLIGATTHNPFFFVNSPLVSRSQIFELRALTEEDLYSLLQRALKEDPYNGAYLDSLGWIYYKGNKLADAEATLRQAVERESHDPTIHSHLGDVYSKLGRTELAAAEWEKSISEWRRSLPADIETDKIAELEKKLSQTKHRVAQKSSSQDAKPR